jgi:hypothetical protein
MNSHEPPKPSADIPLLLWSKQHVAAATGMNVKRIQHLSRSGVLPGFKIGRTWRFDPDAIRAWIKGSGGSQQA